MNPRKLSLQMEFSFRIAFQSSEELIHFEGNDYLSEEKIS